MSAADVPLRYRRLRAPQDDGAALIDPPVAEAVKLVAANRHLAETWDSASGLLLTQWRRWARMSLLFARPSQGHWQTADEERERLARSPLIFSGHQPTLFHPGVWLKNFLLDRIAKQVGGVAIDLLIDNDTTGHAGVRVPTCESFAPRLTNVDYDSAAENVPLEERVIVDFELFRSFGNRVHAAIDPLRRSKSGFSSALIVDRLWEYADEPIRRWGEKGIPLGTCIQYARHRLESELGLSCYADTLSWVCSQPVFREFVNQLLLRWRELHPIYNASLSEYRAINHVRNRFQPAPELAQQDEWLEVPFWIWCDGDSQRRRAFVRCRAGQWELTDRGNVTLLSGGVHVTSTGFREARGSSSRAIKIRPRALITTMFARLILSDLFIHGIGGAKYDELTDVLIRRFFGIEPPAYVTATATFRLPIERPPVTDDDLRAIERRIRDAHYAPETFVGELAGSRGIELNQLAAEKKELIAARWQEKQKKAWHDRVTACNDRMSALLADVRQQLVQQREKLLSDLHTASLLAHREFSFVLFPEETLPRALLDLCAARP